MLGFLLFPQQLFTGFRHQCLGLGDGVVVVARIDGQEHLAGLEETARGEGRMNPDHFAGNFRDEIDFGARGDYPLGMNVQPHRLGAGHDGFDGRRLPFRRLRLDFRLVLDQRPGAHAAQGQEHRRKKKFQSRGHRFQRHSLV